MTRLSAQRVICAFFVLCLGTAIPSSAQTFTSLLDFEGLDGSGPEYISLAQGIDGNFYGTTGYGGIKQLGTVFKITPEGTLITLYSFCSQVNCTDGATPLAGLVLGTDGNLYGTTSQGGAPGTCNSGCGTVFKITAAGKLTTLYTFCVQGINSCKDGWLPYAPLIQASDGNFYGTTKGGGAGGPSGYGTFFRITPSGKLTTVHRFSHIKPSGYWPYGPVVQADDGNFYGTTLQGGDSSGAGAGTVFRITSTSAFSTIYDFSFTGGGVYPYSGLIQAIDGNLYGTTLQGGAGFGTVYGVNTEGSLTFQYNFCSQPHCADGDAPLAPVIQATDGNFYGTTQGSENHGTLFQLTPQGSLTTLYTFCSQMTCDDGADLYGGLLQGTNGIFYGTTASGGDLSCGISGCGTIFSLSMGLGPFVSFVHNPAVVGQPFGILGQGFKGTTSVSLNGSPATFTVVSATLIKATVPQGATTGYVTVTTPTGVLTSNVPFHVIP